MTASEAPEPATGHPGPETRRRAALRLIDAGRRQDPNATNAILAELCPPYVADLADAQLVAEVHAQMIGAVVAVAGELLRERKPRAALAMQLAAISKRG